MRLAAVLVLLMGSWALAGCDGGASSDEADGGSDAGGAGGGGGAGGQGAGTSQDPAAAIASCLEDIGVGEVSCPASGDSLVAWAFDHPVGPAASICGDLSAPADLRIAARFTGATEGIVLHGLRIRAPGWETPVDGEWIELVPPAPVLVTDDVPLPTELVGWTASVLTTPFGLGFLFQQMESPEVEVTLSAALTPNDVVNGSAISLGFTITGGDYLRIDPSAEERTALPEPSALGVGCAHAPVEPLLEAEPLRATPCAPAFDSCPEGTQVCNVSSSGTLMVCEPAAECDASCPFDCGLLGSGSCAP
jgi:hypothetical protein